MAQENLKEFVEDLARQLPSYKADHFLFRDAWNRVQPTFQTYFTEMVTASLDILNVDDVEDREPYIFVASLSLGVWLQRGQNLDTAYASIDALKQLSHFSRRDLVELSPVIVCLEKNFQANVVAILEHLVVED